MRLIMLGTGPVAAPTLQALAAKGHDIPLVISRPPTDRSRTPSPLQQAGQALGLTTWTPETVNVPESQVRIAALAADLLVVCDYGEILKPETLATTRLGGINLHGSLLPKYRGAAPVQWAILNGDAETGNSVIQMTPGLDAGPCLGQQRTLIDPDEDAGELETRLAKLGAELVIDVVDQLAMGTARGIAQDKSQTTKAPRLKKEQGAIDWSQAAEKIKNQVRGLRPWPRAFTFWHPANGASAMRLNVDRVAIAAADASDSAPGTIVQTSPRFLVATGDIALEIVELQPAGKRSMPAPDFLRGNRVNVGDRFGTA
jgi:methionyl-tRNA formyltransferase